jgi:DNA-binding IclR family transcriptional regulator
MDNQRALRGPRADRDLARAVKASKAPAISRAAAVLRLLGKTEAPLGVQSIARELGLVPSTCLHVLRALVTEEFVSFDPETKRYALEAGVLTLARHWLRRNPFNDLVQPVLDRLGRSFGVTMLGVHIVGLEHMVVVAVSHLGQELHLSAQIGSRFPALISATGRCIAAYGDYSPEELQSRFATLRWDKPPTLEEWKKQVAQTRARGFAVDPGYYISGITAVAVPVFSARGKLNHALVAVGIGSGSAMRRDRLPALTGALLDAGRTLSHQLGGEAFAP